AGVRFHERIYFHLCIDQPWNAGLVDEISRRENPPLRLPHPLIEFLEPLLRFRVHDILILPLFIERPYTARWPRESPSRRRRFHTAFVPLRIRREDTPRRSACNLRLPHSSIRRTASPRTARPS